MTEQGGPKRATHGPKPCKPSRSDRAVNTLLVQSTPRRRWLRFTADALVWVVALYAAVILRLDFDVSRLSEFEVVLLVPIAWAAQAGFGYWLGLYRGWWLLGSFEEVAALGPGRRALHVRARRASTRSTSGCVPPR